MAALGAKMERLSSIDAQLRMLVPGKVSEDDKLIEYDALLLDRFLDILQDLHGDDLKEMVPILPATYVSPLVPILLCFILLARACGAALILGWIQVI